MRVHANRDSALVLAAQASKAVPKITTIPELKGIHMEADARLASGAFEFSLAAFCDEIIRTSELTREQIAERLVSSRIA